MATMVVSQSLLPAAQVDDPEERLVIIKVPREGRPFGREHIVDALTDFQFVEWEVVGWFSRGLEFQVLMEKKSDADTLCEMGYIEVGNEEENFACHTRKFKQNEFKVRVDWLPVTTSEHEVGQLFAKFGKVVTFYKEWAPARKNHTRYWGGTFIVVIATEREDVVSTIPDFMDVTVRNRAYSILCTVIGLLPRCHSCKVRGHMKYECTACRLCGSRDHSSEGHSVQNARKRSFNEVVGGVTRVDEYEVEDEVSVAKKCLVKDSQRETLTQLLEVSDGEQVEKGGEDELGEQREVSGDQLVSASQPGLLTQMALEVESEYKGKGKEGEERGKESGEDVKDRGEVIEGMGDEERVSDEIGYGRESKGENGEGREGKGEKRKGMSEEQGDQCEGKEEMGRG